MCICVWYWCGKVSWRVTSLASWYGISYNVMLSVFILCVINVPKLFEKYHLSVIDMKYVMWHCLLFHYCGSFLRGLHLWILNLISFLCTISQKYVYNDEKRISSFFYNPVELRLFKTLWLFLTCFVQNSLYPTSLVSGMYCNHLKYCLAWCYYLICMFVVSLWSVLMLIEIVLLVCFDIHSSDKF
jgi:hypothetical protein